MENKIIGLQLFQFEKQWKKEGRGGLQRLDRLCQDNMDWESLHSMAGSGVVSIYGKPTDD